MSRRDPAALAERVLEGDRLAAARLITLAENRDAGAVDAVKRLFPHTGGARVVGVTGPPGGGKSTLTDKLIAHYRGEGLEVGVIAVDPTSPFTGGAILGDRIRMNDRATDRGVFIRSMGTRGALGGLSRSVGDAVKVLDALGKDVVLIETVGVGQGEVDIVRTADTVVLVTVPGLGDEIQHIKAGIMEIGDVFVVNKADLEGADRAVAELENWLAFSPHDDGWAPPVLKVVAAKGEGVGALAGAIQDHRDFLEREGLLLDKRRERGEAELLDILQRRVTRHVLDEARAGGRFQALVDSIAKRDTDPYTAADELWERHLRGGD